MTDEAVLVPVKAFGQAKVRLAGALGTAERAGLARWMAEQVLRAARPLPVAVACDSPEVAAWAEVAGARVLWTPGLGLNGAVAQGVAALAATGFSRVIVAHADLPFAADLASLAGRPGVTLVADRRHQGTNVACVPAACGFRFSYGPGSLQRHVEAAGRLGLDCEVVRRPDLEWDVDTPADLAGVPARAAAGPA